jgi:hypothetical protein
VARPQAAALSAIAAAVDDGVTPRRLTAIARGGYTVLTGNFDSERYDRILVEGVS